MSESIIIFLDEVPNDDLHVFYNKTCRRIEITDPNNIAFLKSLTTFFSKTKPFIEDTKEEFLASGRTSGESKAMILRIISNGYQTFLKKIEKKAISSSKQLDKRCKEANTNQEKRNFFYEHQELLNLYLFFSVYEDLTQDQNYSNFSYYFIQDSHE
ncbi:hypothetical protein [Methylomagnum sp.]